MKTACRRAALAIALLLAALAGLAYALAPSLAENAARHYLEELPAALVGQGVALAPPEVEDVRFSLSSRELVLRTVRLHGTLMAQDAATSRGSFLATAEELSVRLTFRGLLLATPLGPFLLPAQTETELFPVADSLRARELTASVAETSLALNISATAMGANGIAVDGALLRSLLTDAPTGSAPNGIDWLYAFAAAELRLTGLDLSMEAPVTGESLSATCAEFVTLGLERRHMAEQEARTISCTLPSGLRFTIASLRQEAITLPPKELLRPLERELRRPALSKARLQDAMKTAIAGPEPLIRKSSLSDLSLLPADREETALQIERSVLTWRSSSPLDQELTIEGLSMPVILLEQETGLILPGLSTFALDATLAVRGTGPLASAPERHTGTITARNLCTLAYDVTLDPQNYTAEIALLRGTYANASLRYTDDGLLPRLATSLMPSAEAAMLALKVGVGRICAASTPENEALRGALETFIERPGSLVLSARVPFTLLEALVTMGEGNAGTLISATATPGPRMLGEAMRLLDSTGSSPASSGRGR